MLVNKVSTVISLVDPNTLQGCDVVNSKYWENPFTSVLTRRHLTEFVVLDVEDIHKESVIDNNPGRIKLSGNTRKKFRLCQVELAKLADFGVNDERVSVRCHLGHLLSPGDHVMGYDMRTANLSGMDDDGVAGLRSDRGEKASLSGCLDKVQDVIVVKRKFMISDEKRKNRRQWKLKRFDFHDDEGRLQVKNPKRDQKDLDDFENDLEEDEELRRDVNLYRSENAIKRAERLAKIKASREAIKGDGENEDMEDGEYDDDEDEDDLPEIPLAELLENMKIENNSEGVNNNDPSAPSGTNGNDDEMATNDEDKDGESDISDL